MKTIIIYGLLRSGNHMLISTLLQQFSNPVHINNTTLSHEKYMQFKSVPITSTRVDGKYTGFEQSDCVIISMENKPIDHKEIAKFSNEGDTHVVVLLRNPYNTLASAWKVYTKRTKYPRKSAVKTIANMWPEYAKDILQSTVAVPVLYDMYVESMDYVRMVMTQLGIGMKQVDFNKKIKWQMSSFNAQENKARTHGTINNCVFNDEDEFMEIVDKQPIHDLWKQVLVAHTNTNPNTERHTQNE